MSDEVKAYLAQLREVLPAVPPISVRTLESLHKASDYEGMVRLIREAMNVRVRLRVAWVNSGGHKSPDGREAPAWIALPQNMPRYGTAAFQEVKLTMYLRKSFLWQSTFDEAAAAIAHELSHVVLESIGHPLRKVEKAVDLTAMLLGFRELYKTACYKEWRSGNRVISKGLGYLDRSEVYLANDILSGRNRADRASNDADVSSTFNLSSMRRATIYPLLAVASVILIAWSVPLYSIWSVHDSLVAEQVKMQARLPIKINKDIVLQNIRVGIREITRTYEVSAPKTNIDLSAWEGRIRKSICGGNAKQKIASGATYSYEFRNTLSALIGRISISSCA